MVVAILLAKVTTYEAMPTQAPTAITVRSHTVIGVRSALSATSRVLRPVPLRLIWNHLSGSGFPSMVEGHVDASKDVVRQQSVVTNRLFANNEVIQAIEDNDARKEEIKGCVGKAINGIRHCSKN